MVVILGDMIDHARVATVGVGTAQFLGRDHLAGGGLDQRRAGQENGPLPAHDDRLVGHGGHIGTPGGARPHHASDLRDALGAHIGLVEEDPPEMVAIGKDLGLVRQVRAARVDEVDARQMVRLGDFLCAQMLLDRQRVIGAALHRRIVAHDHALAARNAPDSGDHARAGDFIVIQAIGGELADFEKGRAGV